MLNNSGESGHPCLFLDLRGNAFSFSLLRIMFAVGLSYMAFLLCWGSFLLCPSLKYFYHKWVLNFVDSFSTYIEMIIWLLSFNLLIWCIILIDLHESLHTWDKPNLIFLVLLNCLVRISVSIFSSDNWPIIFFFYEVFIWF